MRKLACGIVALALALPAVAGLKDRQAHQFRPPDLSCRYMIFNLQGQYTATRTGVLKFTAPVAMEIVSVQAVVRASVAALTLDVLVGGASILRSVIDLGTPADGTVNWGSLLDPSGSARVAKDAAISVNLPTVTTSADDITLTIAYRSLVGLEQ